MTNNFVPVDFKVPGSIMTEQYCLEMLSPEVTELDYDAVMSSKNRLRTIFGENTEWPRDDMLLEDNRNDLIRHQEEFNSRKAFAYTVLNLNKNKCLGCVYIEPSRIMQFDCEVYLWVRESHILLDNNLLITVKNWISDCWLFKKPAFPGRDISWKKWNLLLAKQ